MSCWLPETPQELPLVDPGTGIPACKAFVNFARCWIVVLRHYIIQQATQVVHLAPLHRLQCTQEADAVIVRLAVTHMYLAAWNGTYVMLDKRSLP